MKVSNAKEVAMKTDGKNAFYEQNPALFAFNLNILLFFLANCCPNHPERLEVDIYEDSRG